MTDVRTVTMPRCGKCAHGHHGRCEHPLFVESGDVGRATCCCVVETDVQVAESDACPPSHQPIKDEEIAWIVVTLYRDGMGQVDARSVHLRDEGEAHEVATLLAKYGPTWLLGVGFSDDLARSRYDAVTGDSHD